MDKRYLTTKELSQYIGRTPQAIRDLVCRRRLPYRKPCGRLLFVRDEIDRWVQASEGVSFEEFSSSESK